MSVVAMIVTADGIAYAAHDSIAADADGSFRITTSPKIVEADDALIGFVGSWSLGRRALQWLTDSGLDLVRFADEFESTEDDWTILMARAGRLTEISADRSIVEIAPGIDGVTFHAVGAGGDYALGSLLWDHEEGLTSLSRALWAAIEFSTLVKPPILYYQR